MSRIRSTGTRPEARLLALLQAVLGKRAAIRLHAADLPGTPDAVVRSLRAAVFCDGCFYHWCPIHGHFPKSNRSYWLPKLRRNLRRDRASRRALGRRGYAVWRFWEHELRPRSFDRAANRLSRLVARRRIRLAGGGTLAK